MRKTRCGVKFIRNHNATNEYVIKTIKSNYNGKHVGGLVLDMMIRWNSSYVLLDRLLMHQDIIKDIFSFPNNFNGLTHKQKQTLHELALTRKEWELLAKLRKVLEPFVAATSVLSGQHYPTMASCYFVLCSLAHFL